MPPPPGGAGGPGGSYSDAESRLLGATSAATSAGVSTFVTTSTFFIPNKCIRRPTNDAKQAWREKVCLFVIMVTCSVGLVGVFGFVPLLLCEENTVFSLQDIWLQSGEEWVVVHGTIYDVKDLIYRHPGGVSARARRPAVFARALPRDSA